MFSLPQKRKPVVFTAAHTVLKGKAIFKQPQNTHDRGVNTDIKGPRMRQYHHNIINTNNNLQLDNMKARYLIFLLFMYGCHGKCGVLQPKRKTAVLMSSLHE
jgi:hypothetical protein